MNLFADADGGASVNLSGDALIVVAVIVVALVAAWFFARRR